MSGGNIDEEKVYPLTDNTQTPLYTNSYTYGDSTWGDLLTGYNNDTLTYDTIGNPLTYRDGITFTWSSGRQLSRYQKGTDDISYTYDSSGMRLSKNVNGTQYTYLYLGGLLVQETRGSRVINYFYDANGQAIALRYRSSSSADWAYYYYDYNSRGDIVGLYAENGNPECTYIYDA